MTTANPAIIEQQTKPAEVVVRTRSLDMVIDNRAILRNINLEIEAGTYLAIVGANGAGKSTLLRIIATLTPPTSGELNLFGKPVGRDSVAARAKMGMIGHQSMLYRDLSARENLEFFAKLYGIKDPATRVKQMLQMAGLSNRASQPIKAFSRGMVQRVAIARALLHDPQLILADEPFTGLDAPSIASVEQLFADLSNAGKTIILVNHDIEQTLKLAERAIVLRGGKIVIDQPTYRLYEREVLSEVAS